MRAHRRLLSIAALALAAAAAPPSPAAGAEAPKEPLNTWQCGSTFTYPGPGFRSVGIGGVRAATRTVGNTTEITAPNPPYAPGPDYRVSDSGSDQSYNLGSYRDGCFSPARPSDAGAEGIEDGWGTFKGPAAGGNLVVVTARGDIPASAVLYVGDQPVIDPVNNLTCVPDGPCAPPPGGNPRFGGRAPAGTPGWADLSIRFGDRIIWGQTSSSNDYEYIAPPAIRSVTPARGPLEGGGTVDLVVSGDWAGATGVTFGGVASPKITTTFLKGLYDGTWGQYRVSAQVPAGASPGTVDVRATSVGGRVATGETAAADDYTYEGRPTPAPTCASTFTANSRFAQQGQLKIAAKPATPLSTTETAVTAATPAFAAGPAYPVVLELYPSLSQDFLGYLRDGCFYEAPNELSGDLSLGIWGEYPYGRKTPAAAGERVFATVSSRAKPDAVLLFDGTPGTEPIVAPRMVDTGGDESQQPGRQDGWYVSAVAPPHAAGWVELNVRVGGQRVGGRVAADGWLEYVDPTSVRAISPAKGPIGGGTAVSIRLGRGSLIGWPEISFGGSAFQPSSSITTSLDTTDGSYGENVVVATSPAHAAGTVDVTVRTSNMGVIPAASAAADDYTYEAPAPPPPPAGAPKVSGVSGAAFAGVGGLVTIRGTNLGGLRSVKVGSRTATVILSNATQIYAFAPAQGKGSYPVTVTTKVGTATAPTNLIYRSLF